MKTIKLNQYFNQFPWDELEDAYGKATDAPIYLSQLIGEDDEAREDAINDYLYARPWHQWDVYSSTPYAIKCVHYIIKNVDVSRLKIDDTPLLYFLLHFILICTHGAKTDEKLKDAIIEGNQVYKRFQNHPNAKTAKISNKLVKFCMKKTKTPSFQ